MFLIITTLTYILVHEKFPVSRLLSGLSAREDRESDKDGYSDSEADGPPLAVFLAFLLHHLLGRQGIGCCAVGINLRAYGFYYVFLGVEITDLEEIHGVTTAVALAALRRGYKLGAVG